MILHKYNLEIYRRNTCNVDTWRAYSILLAQTHSHKRLAEPWSLEQKLFKKAICCKHTLNHGIVSVFSFEAKIDRIKFDELNKQKRIKLHDSKFIY